jgi:hypothetical protein
MVGGDVEGDHKRVAGPAAPEIGGRAAARSRVGCRPVDEPRPGRSAKPRNDPAVCAFDRYLPVIG